MSITDRAARLAQDIEDQVFNMVDGVNEALFEPVIRLGVTGLARSGKTVFVTSLIANLLARGRMNGLAAEAEGRILGVQLRPQPDDDIARFSYETHLDALMGAQPVWPQSTRTVSTLRLSLLVKPRGLRGGIMGPRRVHLDIIDYPGEWLLDLALLDRSYGGFSAASHQRLKTWAADGVTAAQDYLDMAQALDGAAPHDEAACQRLAAAFTAALKAAAQAGYLDAGPGRFLMPGDLAGAPMLVFAPMLGADRGPRSSLNAVMARRFETYKTAVVRPFFTRHFMRIDRQIVLVDVLSAAAKGPKGLRELRDTMTQILSVFRTGRGSLLARLIGRGHVSRVLFAATKLDHLPADQHSNMASLLDHLLRDARERAAYRGAKVAQMTLASLRATTADTRRDGGRELACVRGRLSTGESGAVYPGRLPPDLTEAAHGFAAPEFAPPLHVPRAGSGPAHIGLDRALNFLLEDLL